MDDQNVTEKEPPSQIPLKGELPTAEVLSGDTVQKAPKIQSAVIYDTSGSTLKALISQFNSGAKNDPKRLNSQNMSQDDQSNMQTFGVKRQFLMNRQQSVEIHGEESDISVKSQQQMPIVPPLMMDQFETNDKIEGREVDQQPLTSNRAGASLYIPYMLPPEEQHFTARNEKPLSTQEKKEDDSNPIKRAITNKINAILEFTQTAMPLIRTGVSIQADIKQGWRPKFDATGAPIPLYYDFEPFEMPFNQATGEYYTALYIGPRYKHSIAMHQAFANKTLPNGKQSYAFKEPPNMSMINQIIKQTHNPEPPREFLGMNPKLYENDEISKELIFDSNFESGNLDTVIKKKDGEYDLFMRVDTNTRGHHQWFYYSVQSNKHFMGKKVRFNVINFTKSHSLYSQGMKVCISKKCYKYKWIKGGEDIQYKPSPYNKKDQNGFTYKQYFQLSFLYEFSELEETTYFAYCFPYDFSKLVDFLASQKLALKALNGDYCKETILCQSLGGVDVPLLTVSSRLTSDPTNYQDVHLDEFQDAYSRVSLPFYKKKKQIVICARVHPGESNASYMMEGFIKSILGDSLQAKELRKRCVFKIIPMVNPDGVIVGNYRTNMAGNDLNRKYHAPDDKLHPTVCAIKKIVHNICYPEGTGEDEEEVPDDEKVFAFIDMHGHSRKKNVFVYGPYYPLHNDRYLRMRVLPKLISEETSKFRFFSCKFRIERSKEKAARIVLWREFNIMNCFTFEASFYGALNDKRQTEEFTCQALESMGMHLCNALYEYMLIIEEEERLKRIKEINKKKKQQAANSNSARKKKKQQLGNKAVTVKTTPRVNQIASLTLNGANYQNIDDKEQSNNQDSNNNEGGMLNPNEPPSSLNSHFMAFDEEAKRENQILMEQLRSKSQSHMSGGIRSLKDMFKLLKNEDDQKDRMTIDEENESSSDDETRRKNVSPSKIPPEGDSGSDSDPLEGELTGKEQAALFSDIKCTIDQFENFFSTGVLKKRGKSYVKKMNEQQKRNNADKSPLANAPVEHIKQTVKEVSPQKKAGKQDLNEGQATNTAIVPMKTKGSFKRMQEESKGSVREQYQMHQKPKVAAIVAHTNIEFFSKDQAVLKIPQIQYTQVKQPTMNIGITTHTYGQPNMRATSKAPFNNPLIVQKISTEDQQISNMIPHKIMTSVFANPNIQQQRQISTFNRTHMSGGVSNAASFNQALEDSLLESSNNNGSFFVCGNPVHPPNHNNSVFPIAQPQEEKQNNLFAHTFYGTGTIQRQQDFGSARKRPMDVDQMKQNLARQRQQKNVSPHIQSSIVVAANQFNDRQETSQQLFSRQIPQPQPIYFGVNSQTIYIMNQAQNLNLQQHAKNLSDYDLANVSISETQNLGGQKSDAKSISYRPYQQQQQPPSMELATLHLLNTSQQQHTITLNSAKHTQQQLFKNQPRQQSQNNLVHQMQQHQLAQKQRSPSRFEKKRSAFHNQQTDEENLEGESIEQNDDELMQVIQMAAQCYDQTDHEAMKRADHRILNPNNGGGFNADIASGTIVLQSQSGMSQKQRQQMNVSKGKEQSVFVKITNQKPTTPKNFKQTNSVNLATLSGHPAFQDTPGASDLERTATHVFASASPNKKRAPQHMHPALLPEQQPSVYTKVALAQHGTASGTQLPHIIQFNNEMMRGAVSLDKKSRMTAANHANVDRYQSLQAQSQHVYTNTTQQLRGGPQQDSVFKSNAGSYKISQQVPGKQHNLKQYEEIQLPEAATGVSIGQQQQSNAKRRNSRGNPSLHNSGKTATEISNNQMLNRTDSKKQSAKFQAIVDSLVQEHIDIYNSQQYRQHF